LPRTSPLAVSTLHAIFIRAFLPKPDPQLSLEGNLFLFSGQNPITQKSSKSSG